MLLVVYGSVNIEPSYYCLLYTSILPEEVRKMMPFFIINNWIESYQTRRGIRSVLNTLSKRSSLPNETRFAMKALKKNYYALQDDFMEFFPQLIDYVEKDFGIEISHRITTVSYTHLVMRKPEKSSKKDLNKSK